MQMYLVPVSCSTLASAFVIPSFIVAHRPMSSASPCNNARRSNEMITIDSDDTNDADQQQRQRGKQSLDSKQPVKGSKQKIRGQIDGDSDSDDVFEAMRQKLKQPAARTTTKKKRLHHLPDNDSSSDDDFEVMRQKLRKMQNSKVKEMERRKFDNADARPRPPSRSAFVAPGNTKNIPDEKQPKGLSDDIKATASLVAESGIATADVDANSEATKQSPAKPKQDVIELLDDSDSDDNPVPKQDRKRKARTSASSLEDEVKSIGIRAMKRELESRGVSTSLFIEKSELVSALVRARREGRMPITKKQDDLIPFHLFATSSSKRLSKEKLKYFKTLRQVIGLDVPRQLKWLVISNFALDFGYLLEETLPEILQFHRVVVFYSYCRNPDAMAKWKDLLRGSGNTVEFIQLDPSAPANSRTNPLPIQIEYGMHHTKMFLTGYDEIIDGNIYSMIRVAVHTSNLLRGDNEMKANGAYTQNFPLKQSHASNHANKRMKRDDAESACSFELDLARYLESYGYSKRQKWYPSTASLSGKSVDSSRVSLSFREFSLPDLIRQYDFSTAYAVLIPSIPGRHKHETYHNFGYLKLRKAIIDAFPAFRQKGVNSDAKPPVLCQMSSLGYLNQKYLGKFHEAIDYTSTHNARPVQDYDRVSKHRPPLQQCLQIVWPTVDEIRNSIEGYYGGGSVCGKTKNVSLEFLKPLYRRWTNVSSDPLQTSRHVPHIKTFLQPSNDGRSIDWLCLTSHNLSIAAWGQVQKRSKNQTNDEKILFIRHWELGVFFSADTLSRGNGKQARIVPLADIDTDSNGIICLDGEDDEGEDGDVIRVPLPYSLHTPSYAGNENPWTDDSVFYQQPDVYGRHGLL